MMFARLIENNNWEAETWSYFLETTAFAKEIKFLRQYLLNNDPKNYILDDRLYTERQIKKMPSLTKYRSSANIVRGFNFDKTSDDPLYKGQCFILGDLNDIKLLPLVTKYSKHPLKIDLQGKNGWYQIFHKEEKELSIISLGWDGYIFGGFHEGSKVYWKKGMIFYTKLGDIYKLRAFKTCIGDECLEYVSENPFGELARISLLELEKINED